MALSTNTPSLLVTKPVEIVEWYDIFSRNRERYNAVYTHETMTKIDALHSNCGARILLAVFLF